VEATVDYGGEPKTCATDGAARSATPVVAR
jgi:hypothetical protein